MLAEIRAAATSTGTRTRGNLTAAPQSSAPAASMGASGTTSTSEKLHGAGTGASPPARVAPPTSSMSDRRACAAAGRRVPGFTQPAARGGSDPAPSTCGLPAAPELLERARRLGSSRSPTRLPEPRWSCSRCSLLTRSARKPLDVSFRTSWPETRRTASSEETTATRSVSRCSAARRSRRSSA